MSIQLIITRGYDQSFAETGKQIELDEWLRLIAADASLKLRREPSVAPNPRTGDVISIPALPGQTDLAVAEKSVPFLGYRRGELVMKYVDSMNEAANPVREKIVEIARRLGAIITHDAGDEILEW